MAPARLAPGAAVRVRRGPPEPHCRTPFYLRGRPGVVEAFAGVHRDPSLLAYCRPGLPARALYRVRFRQRDLWPDYAGAADDSLVADIYEHWLDPVEG